MSIKNIMYFIYLLFMPEVPITKKTQWECIQCGRCCHDFILSQGMHLSIIKDGKEVCQFHDHSTKLCTIYDKRPFICRIYPLVMNTDVILDKDGTARPQRALALENMTIHTECPGYGQGKRIYSNKNLQKKIEKLALAFALSFKEAHEKKKDATRII